LLTTSGRTINQFLPSAKLSDWHGTGVNGLAASPSFVVPTAGDSAFNLNSGIPAYTLSPNISGSYGTFFTSQTHGAAVGMAYPDPYLGDRAPYADKTTTPSASGSS
jgi:hypothetical protein